MTRKLLYKVIDFKPGQNAFRVPAWYETTSNVQSGHFNYTDKRSKALRFDKCELDLVLYYMKMHNTPYWIAVIEEVDE